MNYSTTVAEGVCPGRISHSSVEGEGFGFDPIFIPADLDADYYIPKAWKSAPGQGCGEKCDLCCFKCIFYFPVVVTFFIFAFLVAFYAFVSH